MNRDEYNVVPDRVLYAAAAARNRERIPTRVERNPLPLRKEDSSLGSLFLKTSPPAENTRCVLCSLLLT